MMLYMDTSILKYVEDLKRGTNTEIGLKNHFEMAYSLYPSTLS